MITRMILALLRLMISIWRSFRSWRIFRTRNIDETYGGPHSPAITMTHACREARFRWMDR